jgi:hypothetical protein
MTMYARSDYQTEGPVPGCGETHQRPLDPRTGQPVALWALDCPVHEARFKGSRRGVVTSPISKSKPGPLTYGMIDAHPGWASTPESVPMTPDEERTDARFRESAQAQINAMNALGTALSNGLQIPAEMMYLLRKQLPAEMLVTGTVLCAEGHDNAAGAKFCAECGMSMAVKAAIGTGDPGPRLPAADLTALPVQSLRKRCRQAGLPDAGSKADLLARLAA